MKKRLIILLAIVTSSVFAKTEPVFLFDRDHQDAIILKNGAKLENGKLKLDGRKGYAEFKDSEALWS